MENIIKAIDVDNIASEAAAHIEAEDDSLVDDKTSQNGLPHSLESSPCESVKNLRIEETRICHKSTLILCEWMKRKFTLKTFALIKVKFEEKDDFKHMMDAVQRCQSLTKFSIQSMTFNMELHGQSLGKAITNESIK
jgi:hypothetical protein